MDGTVDLRCELRSGARGDTAPGPASGRRRFTLLELLAVLAVTALLMSLLLPALDMARRRARQAACTGQVRQLGIAVHAYAGDWDQRLPVAARLGPEPFLALASLPEVLRIHAGDPGLFHCPADRGEAALFPEFGTSYEWNTLINGRLIDRASFRVAGLDVVAPLLGDADPVHGAGRRNFLYSDGRVSASLEILIHAH